VGPRVGLAAMEKRKICFRAGSGTRAVQPVAIPTELSRLHIYIAGSRPDEVRFFNVPNPSSRTVALRSTQQGTGVSRWL
jgi:hypothetical protein